MPESSLVSSNVRSVQDGIDWILGTVVTDVSCEPVSVQAIDRDAAPKAVAMLLHVALRVPTTEHP